MPAGFDLIGRLRLAALGMGILLGSGSHTALCAELATDLATEPASAGTANARITATDGVAATAPLATAGMQRRVPMVLEVRNQSAELATAIAVGVFLPVAAAVRQQCCQQIEASMAYELLTDALGNQAMRFRLPPLPPHAARMIRLTATLQHQSNAQANPGYRARASIKSMRLLLAAEPLIEVDSEQIQHIAMLLKEANPMATASAINDWVSNHLQYSGYRRNAIGALAALNHRQGDCTEFAHLFIALARAADLPARTMAGYVLGPTQRPSAAGLHNWAEVLVHARWLIADPQHRLLGDGDGRYLATRRLGVVPEAPWPSEAVRFWVEGDGVSVRMR